MSRRTANLVERLDLKTPLDGLGALSLSKRL
jgi:hypothetical protein